MQEEPRKSSIRGANNVMRDGEIVGQKVNGMAIVERDTADLGRCQHDRVGFRVTDPLLRFRLAGEIKGRVIDRQNRARF